MTPPDLARRALAAGFAWESGVRWAWEGSRLYAPMAGRIPDPYRPHVNRPTSAALPDFDDTPTLGVLSQQARAAWAALHPGASFSVTHHPRLDCVEVQVSWGLKDPEACWSGIAPTEAEVLIMALESAKKRKP